MNGLSDTLENRIVYLEGEIKANEADLNGDYHFSEKDRGMKEGEIAIMRSQVAFLKQFLTFYTDEGETGRIHIRGGNDAIVELHKHIEEQSLLPEGCVMKLWAKLAEEEVIPEYPRFLEKSIKLEIGNPSDTCFFITNDVEAACAITLFISEGQYFLKDEKENIVFPPMMFKGMDDLVRIWNKKFGHSLDDFSESEEFQKRLIAVCNTFTYAGERSSLNDIEGAVKRLQQKLLRQIDLFPASSPVLCVRCSERKARHTHRKDDHTVQTCCGECCEEEEEIIP